MVINGKLSQGYLFDSDNVAYFFMYIYVTLFSSFFLKVNKNDICQNLLFGEPTFKK